MNNYVVWLDSMNAHVFKLKVTGVEKTIVTKSNMDHHTRHKNDRRENSDSNSEHYFKNLVEKLVDADQLLLMGPGLAKNHFKNHLETHQTHTIAQKIIGLENLESFEHTTEKQMMDQAHKYFKTYDLFHNPI